ALLGQTEVEWELRAIGDEISAWGNGQRVASVHDSRVPRGDVSFSSDVGLEITRMETIDFASSTAAASPALDPGAIKLWDAPEKTPRSTYARWENEAVRIDGHALTEQVSGRDLVLRATVLLNP